jgi:glucose-6-phosphate isomerase
LQLIQNQEDEELPVPGRPFTFGQLISAQSNGDAEVLESTGLPVLTLKLNKPLEALELLRRLFSSN